MFLIWAGLALSFALAFAPVNLLRFPCLSFRLARRVMPALTTGRPQPLIYSAFPQNLEMLWTLGLLAGGDTVSNLIGG